MMKLRVKINFLYFIVIFCFFGQAVASEEKLAWVSMINLIATPERFHDKKVMISGFVYIETENNSICLMKSPPTGKECLWLEIFPRPVVTEDDFKEYMEEEKRWESNYHHRFVTLHGRFDMHNDGHLSNQSGAIKEITYVVVRDERVN